MLDAILSGLQDRNSIGNARIMGLLEDLHLTDQQYYNCLMMFCEYCPLRIYAGIGAKPIKL